MIKIALHGKYGSGKSTFLTTAQTLYPELQLQDAKFAQYLYNCMYSVQDTLGLENEKDGAFLQMLGTHYRNKYGGYFWVDMFFKLDQSNHIITDMRYPEELESCKNKGYTTIKIVRDDGFRLEHTHGRDPKHISETAMDKIKNSEYDYIVNNNGNLEQLEGSVAHIINELLRKRNK